MKRLVDPTAFGALTRVVMPRGPCGSIAGSSVSRAHRCVEHESAAMIADGCTRLFITRDALDQSRPGPGPGPDAEAFAARVLADGEMRLAIDPLHSPSTNITYAAFGEAMK